MIEAADAASAFRILEERPEIRVLFTDVQMPGQDDGLALVQKVSDRWPHVLLLVASGGLRLTNQDIPDHGRFLEKPYDEKIVTEIEDMIAEESKRSNDER